MNSMFTRLLLISLFLVAQPALAQVGGIIIEVTNIDQRVVSGATVTVEARDGARRSQPTADDGTVTFLDLETGFYRVSASAPDMNPVAEPAVRVVRDKTVPVELQLTARSAEIQEVTVVANSVRIDSYGAASTTYFGREDLRSAVGSGSDVLRAFDGAPGVFSTGEFANFTVRGLGPRDNLFLVDEFPYDKVVHFDESLGELDDVGGGGRYSVFAPNIIGGAEFSPGGWSAAFGGRNAALLKLDVARGNPSPSASLRLDPAGGELIYDGPSGLREDTSVIFTARRFDFSNLFDLIGEGAIGEPVLTDVILKTHTDINANNELEFLLLYTPEEFTRGVENVLESEGFEERELATSEQDSMLLGLTHRYRFGAAAEWSNRFYFRESDKISASGEAFPFSNPQSLTTEQIPVRENILTLEEREEELGWRSDLKVDNSFGVFSAGLRLVNLDLGYSTVLDGNWIRYEYRSDDFRPVANQRYIELTPELTNSQLQTSVTQTAAFVEQLFEFGRLDVRLGLRQEFDEISDDNYLAPRLAANYYLTPSTRISATAGSFYQSPRYLDRARDARNAALANERIDHYSLGVSHNISSDWNLLVEAYYRELDDLVVDADIVTGLSGNAGTGTSYGVDVVVNRYFAGGWSANAAYSYNNLTLDDNDGGGEYPGDNNFEHIFTVGGRWEINERWQVGARWKYASGRPADAFVVYEDVLAESGGPLRYSREFITNNTERLDDFNVMNVRVDYRRPVGPVDAVAFVDVINLFGTSQTDQLDFNEVTGEVLANEGGAFPLIGLRFEKTW